MALPLKDAFTARALGYAFNKYQESLGTAPYLGRSFFGTDKRQGLTLRWIKGSKGLPVALKGSNFDAQAPLRDGIGFADIQNEMPFFRESYMVTEREEQDYMNYVSAENGALANQVLREIMKKPLDLILGADVVPERMIWNLIAPADGIPRIPVVIDGDATNKKYYIDYTADAGVAYKSTNFMQVVGANDVWTAAATATPIQDLVDAQAQHLANTGENLTVFVMNQTTWRALVAAEDTKKRVQGVITYNAGMPLMEADVKRYLVGNYGITVLVYNKMYMSEAGTATTFIPNYVITAMPSGIRTLGTLWYGTTPEERSGSLANGSLSIVNTGVSVYTYTTEHPVNTHCVVSEICLPSYEAMDSVFVLKVA